MFVFFHTYVCVCMYVPVYLINTLIHGTLIHGQNLKCLSSCPHGEILARVESYFRHFSTMTNFHAAITQKPFY